VLIDQTFADMTPWSGQLICWSYFKEVAKWIDSVDSVISSRDSVTCQSC